MFKKILIADRGEIAVRLTQTIQEMGLKAVALYSDPDAASPHVLAADEAYPLEGTAPRDTYLNIAKIIDIARNAKIDAIHPGYGFLSENAEFANACAKAKIAFIGPSPDVIHAMGDKIIAKQTMEKAGVPVVPGWSGDLGDKKIMDTAAQSIGYPILVKAAAGGGGKGMRIVRDPKELEAALESAQHEAQNAFGDNRVFLEKYIESPRHIEFQIFGDNFGNVVHLFERECSIQRRHQKIIEESPSVAMTDKLRVAMGHAAVKAAQAIGYTNAGTVEFILDPKGNFYFLEVNTRLQVEHPVTELVTRQDLVNAQLQIAMGQPLPFSQDSLKQQGHAIECRIYAEDPASNFLPSTGKLHVYREPSGPGIRVDSGFREGNEVTVHYDPMLAKLIVWGADRKAAIQKMEWALHHYPVLGVTTNIDYLQAILAHPKFQSGEIDTHFLERHAIKPPSGKIPYDKIALAAQQGKTVSTAQQAGTAAEVNNPWLLAGAWRGN